MEMSKEQLYKFFEETNSMINLNQSLASSLCRQYIFYEYRGLYIPKKVSKLYQYAEQKNRVRNSHHIFPEGETGVLSFKTKEELLKWHQEQKEIDLLREL